ncbi:P-loop NTPase, partial [Nocardiopsis tropica]|nr:P-loop NTPase [Nocardiopsis tropica]
RAGAITAQTHQRIAGVIENMSYFVPPGGGEPLHLFGEGGGQTVADALTKTLGTTIPLLGQVPLDTRLREGGDEGTPLVLSDPDTDASKVISGIAESLVGKPRGLAGMQLGISPAGR